MHAFPKSVLVTGATGGIGLAVCDRLARAGASLLLAARDVNKLQSLCSQLPDNGAGGGHAVVHRRAVVHPGDDVPAGVLAVFDRAAGEFVAEHRPVVEPRRVGDRAVTSAMLHRGGTVARADGPLRASLDAALSSPSRRGVIVDDTGVLVGTVLAHEVLTAIEQAERPRLEDPAHPGAPVA